MDIDSTAKLNYNNKSTRSWLRAIIPTSPASKSLYFRYAQEAPCSSLTAFSSADFEPHSDIGEQWWAIRSGRQDLRDPHRALRHAPYLSYAGRLDENLKIDPTTLKTVDDYYAMLPPYL
jgi:putative aldouronate transport system substrate-binding protein